MPDIITHYIFGLDTAHNIKSSPLYSVIKEHKDLFLVGLQGPDPIYYHHLRRKDSKSMLAAKMHQEKTGDFLVSALCHIKKYSPESKEFAQCLSYLSGFMCHYILDSMAHPYVFYLGGHYISDSPETNKYKGLHKKVELAIDSILLEDKLSVKASHFKVYKQILGLSKIPAPITTLFDDTLFLLYGINNAGTVLSESYQDMKTYYKLTYDHFGTKKALTSVALPLIPKQLTPFISNFSYYNCVNPDFDYMNKNRHVWLHPVTGNVYTFSFYDILRNANKKSSVLLLATYDFALGNISADQYRSYLPNISYLTGLPTDDTRPMKYFMPDCSQL